MVKQQFSKLWSPVRFWHPAHLMVNTIIKRFETLPLLAQFAADEFERLAKVSITEKGSFYVALSGGNTPKLMYSLLVNKDIEWNRIFLYWGDERFVPLDHTESTYLMVKEVLIDKIKIPETNIFAVPTYMQLDKARVWYENKLPKQFDLVLLGMGEDGHTASLFPYSSTLASEDAVAIELNSPKPPSERLTFTFKTINNAKNRIILVADKNKALEEVLEGEKNIQKYPIQGVKTPMWLIK